ncbi:acyl-CoA dehydrogenase family protein [Nonomuraea insulae]|uniref:Acyl-CoA dehydrogenase family protein n=1 Tax=Nonomuraea insulae TaxID=1616787 RepID=A0ABW1D7P0_9ACTN
MMLDGRLRLLQRHAREWARELRPHALAVDRDAAALTPLLSLPAVALAAPLQVPPEYSDRPVRIDGVRFHVTGALERAVWCEEIAWGDLGIGLASPGASMAGALVDMLGSRAQQRWFYERVQEEPTWTFFGLTEEHAGSDPGSMRSVLTTVGDDRLLLSGAKRYVSNAVRARLGVVFARTAPGPFGIDAVLVEAGAPGFRARPLSTIGVRGAQLGEITLSGVEVRADQVLGVDVPRFRRAVRGWRRALNLLRPTVAAMAVGLARAAREYVTEHRRSLSATERARLDRMDCEIECARAMTLSVAMRMDGDPDAGYLASAAKQRAARLAAEVTRAALGFFGNSARLEHPLLDKLARDALGVQFMEGAGDIHRLNVGGALVRRSFHPGDALE